MGMRPAFMPARVRGASAVVVVSLSDTGRATPRQPLLLSCLPGSPIWLAPVATSSAWTYSAVTWGYPGKRGARR